MYTIKKWLKQLKHRLVILKWILGGKQKPLDFFGEAIISLSGRRQNEWFPVLSYLSMFEPLRQEKFGGDFLELGGGYSTILANLIFAEDAEFRSVDICPQKYDRILNSRKNAIRFLESIDRVDRLTVTLPEIESALIELKRRITLFGRQNVSSILIKYCKEDKGGPSAEVLTKKLLDVIFGESEDALLEFYRSTDAYESEKLFYLNNGGENGSAYCTELKLQGKRFDAIFYDCGEISSVGEWVITSDLIPVGGYALFHDVYYPKSIKNFLVCTLVELSEDWEIVYRDIISQQGAILAKRIS